MPTIFEEKAKKKKKSCKGIKRTVKIGSMMITQIPLVLLKPTFLNAQIEEFLALGNGDEYQIVSAPICSLRKQIRCISMKPQNCY